jgi:hypothetical protein
MLLFGKRKGTWSEISAPSLVSWKQTFEERWLEPSRMSGGGVKA